MVGWGGRYLDLPEGWAFGSGLLRKLLVSLIQQLGRNYFMQKFIGIFMTIMPETWRKYESAQQQEVPSKHHM